MAKSESRIQSEIVIWFRNNYCRKGAPKYNPFNLIAHVKNEHAFGRDSTVHPGFADLIIFLFSPLPIFVEVKEPGNLSGPLKNGQSGYQVDFEDWCNKIGRPYFIVRSLEEFMQVIENL